MTQRRKGPWLTYEAICAITKSWTASYPAKDTKGVETGTQTPVSPSH